MKKISLLPGPTYIPPKVQNKLRKQPISQRNSELEYTFLSTQNMIKKIIDNPFGEIFLLSGSGTLAMETTISCVPIIKKNPNILIIETGKFGKRFTKLCHINNFTKHTLKFNKSIDYSLIKKTIFEKDINTLLFQATETSSGIRINFKEIRNIKNQKKELLIISDSISDLLSNPFSQQLYNIDIVIGASQKGFSSPTGISFISFLPETYNKINLPNFETKNLYNSITTYLKSPIPFTPSINNIYSLHKACELILQKGIKKIITKNTKINTNLSNFFNSYKWEEIPTDKSYSLLVLKAPNNFNTKTLLDILYNDYNISIANGQEHLKNKAIRIGTMGLTPIKYYKYLKKVCKKVFTKLDL